MDKQDAKLILSSYTLGDEPVDDARFLAAKRCLETDPELAEWWERQKRRDRALQRDLRATPVPEDLRAALRETVAHQRRKRLRFGRARAWFSVAAAVALVSLLVFQYAIDRSDDYTGPLAQRAYQYSVDGPRLKYFNKDTQSLKDWLSANGFSLPDQLPPKLLALQGIGCRPLDWSQERVALMCFEADTVYHLFIGSEQDFPEFEASDKIEYASLSNGWTMSKWKDQDHLFVLTAQASPQDMSRFLAAYTPSATRRANSG